MPEIYTIIAVDIAGPRLIRDGNVEFPQGVPSVHRGMRRARIPRIAVPDIQRVQIVQPRQASRLVGGADIQFKPPQREKIAPRPLRSNDPPVSLPSMCV